MQPSDLTDRASYQTWQAVEAAVVSPLDRTAAFWKYVLSAYHYFRSRLAVPGRAYDSDEHGMLAIGGSAHVDVMDLEVKLQGMSDDARGLAYEWTLDSSQEKVAEWRRMGRGYSQPTVSRRRKGLIENLSADDGE